MKRKKSANARKKEKQTVVENQRRPLLKFDPSIENILLKAREQLAAFVKNEDCDHEAGICFCESFQALHDFDVLLGVEAANEVQTHPWLLRLARRNSERRVMDIEPPGSYTRSRVADDRRGRPVNVNNRRIA